uniref:Uncharacterized protein n=1 Tax=Photinus pyralis TaxID=7054 RepID=A0A1Y1N9P0_PHOPY
MSGSIPAKAVKIASAEVSAANEGRLSHDMLAGHEAGRESPKREASPRIRPVLPALLEILESKGILMLVLRQAKGSSCQYRCFRKTVSERRRLFDQMKGTE